MLPDDAFRAQLRDARAMLATWAASVRNAANVESTEGDNYWCLRAEPAAERACPFELIVHHDQHFDACIGPETYERRPIANLNLLVDLVEAIGDGRVVTRSHVSCNTGAVRAVETIVTLAGGGRWQAERPNEEVASTIRIEDCEARDRHYVPYQRQ